MLPSEPHTEFLELCALSTTGELSRADQKRLEEHLLGCPSCSEARKDYEALVDQAIPDIAAGQPNQLSPGPRWSEKRAEEAFFDRLAREQDPEKDAEEHPEIPASPPSETTKDEPNDDSPSLSSHLRPARSRSPECDPISRRVPSWRQVWLLYAAGILLFLNVGFYAYRVHLRSGGQSGPIAQTRAVATDGSALPSLEEQLSDAGHERELAEAQIRERDQMISELRRRLAEEAANISQLKDAQARFENQIQSSESASHELALKRMDELARKQSELKEKLSASENSSRTLQDKVNSLADQSAQDRERARTLQLKNDDLTRLLRDRETELERQDQLLAHDQDIRELMGARDLYIAEVYDITRTGETKKAYGRLFYTRGKSLIFYAYDLDQEMAARDANSFQAWGRRGPDRGQAVNLGIFYEDNVARKRWILKCEDSKALAQIDGVFVTLEPNGGSSKPSGKSLLFAYLRLSPNHP